MERLRAESRRFDFAATASEPGGPIDTYLVRFRGPSLFRTPDRADVRTGWDHEVLIRLGASYPRQAPSLAWRTPIFHPNISTSGAVCLGGYSTFWVPSLQLDQLCEMLWDMLRLKNFDVKSPYNREAAHWLQTQTSLRLPLEDRPLREVASASESITPTGELAPVEAGDSRLRRAEPQASPATAAEPEVVIVDAEVVIVDEPEILFIR